MSHELVYRGITASVMRCGSTGVYVGFIDRGHCSHSFEGDSLGAVEAAFHEIVDECMSKGQTPTDIVEASFAELDAQTDEDRQALAAMEADPFAHGKRYDC